MTALTWWQPPPLLYHCREVLSYEWIWLMPWKQAISNINVLLHNWWPWYRMTALNPIVACQRRYLSNSIRLICSDFSERPFNVKTLMFYAMTFRKLIFHISVMCFLSSVNTGLLFFLQNDGFTFTFWKPLMLLSLSCIHMPTCLGGKRISVTTVQGQGWLRCQKYWTSDLVDWRCSFDCRHQTSQFQHFPVSGKLGRG